MLVNIKLSEIIQSWQIFLANTVPKCYLAKICSKLISFFFEIVSKISTTKKRWSPFCWCKQTPSKRTGKKIVSCYGFFIGVYWVLVSVIRVTLNLCIISTYTNFRKFVRGGINSRKEFPRLKWTVTTYDFNIPCSEIVRNHSSYSVKYSRWSVSWTRFLNRMVGAFPRLVHSSLPTSATLLKLQLWDKFPTNF